MKFLRSLLILAVLLAIPAYIFFRQPFGPHAETFVDIPAGTGTPGIATRLQSAGIIRSHLAFEFFRKCNGGTLKAGEYRFDHPVSLPEVYRRLVRGDVYTKTLVIPEGFNLFDIAQAVQDAGLGNAQDFLAAERTNTQLIADFSPHATSLEGFLFPDTYKFSPHATPLVMLTAMVHRFRQRSAALGLAPGLAPGPNLLRTVTMASLVEREVHIDSERPVVAGVFENRLKLGMPLATDPAVVYAALLANRWRGTIYQSDLQYDSPYNTYKHPGLPPGPICNPGAAALAAALHPTPTQYLYFEAAPDGSTQFSVDLKQHAAQVQAYRQALAP